MKPWTELSRQLSARAVLSWTFTELFKATAKSWSRVWRGKTITKTGFSISMVSRHLCWSEKLAWATKTSRKYSTWFADLTSCYLTKAGFWPSSPSSRLTSASMRLLERQRVLKNQAPWSLRSTTHQQSSKIALPIESKTRTPSTSTKLRGRRSRSIFSPKT